MLYDPKVANESTCYWGRSILNTVFIASHLSSCQRMHKVQLSRHTKELLCQAADKTAFAWLLAWTLLQLWKKNAPSRHPVWWIRMEDVKTQALLLWGDLSAWCSLLFLFFLLLLRLFWSRREYPTFLICAFDSQQGDTLLMQCFQGHTLENGRVTCAFSVDTWAFRRVCIPRKYK